MATIVLTIQDAQLTRVVTAICDYFGYSATLMGGAPNPETANQFAKRMLVEQAKTWVAIQEGRVANAAAVAAANSQITIT